MIAAGAFPARLVEARFLCDDVRACVFEAEDRERFEFLPGQHLRLGLRRGDWAEDRYYSIASPPGQDNRFELLMQLSDDEGGRFLRAMPLGQELAAWGPSGHFGLRRPLRDAIFVATGTGIAPLRAMLETALLEAPEGRFELIYGSRFPERLLERERFEELARQYPGFRFTPTVTQPHPEWSGGAGRVQGHLEAAVAGRESAVDVYFCGRPEMIADCYELLRARGVAADSLLFERY
ncbi:MAG: hypothetical protein GC160_10835 [Acidobacteria bacterium]|nr:hypothetical protein [Acidobacteriota bacterium]